MRRQSLTGLGPDEVGALVGSTSAEVEAIRADTGGNPLLVTHMSVVCRAAIAAGVAGAARRVARRRVAGRARSGGDVRLRVRRRSFGGRPRRTAAARSRVPGSSRCRRARRRSPVSARVVHVRACPVPVPRYGALSLRGDSSSTHERPPRWPRRSTTSESSERARQACLALPLGDGGRSSWPPPPSTPSTATPTTRRSPTTGGPRCGPLLDPPDPAVTLDVRIAAALHHRGDPEGLPMLLDAARRAETWATRMRSVRAATAIPQFGAVGFVDPMPEGRASPRPRWLRSGRKPSPAPRPLADGPRLALAVPQRRRGARLAARPRRSLVISTIRRSSARAAQRAPPVEPSKSHR